MSATRLVLVLILLATTASSGYSQILRPRLRIARAIDSAILKNAEQVAGQLAAAGIKDAMEHLFDDIAPYAGAMVELQLSALLVAATEQDPQKVKEMIKARDNSWYFDLLLEKGCSRLLATEIDKFKFTEQMRDSKLSTPVLQKITLDYEFGRLHSLPNNLAIQEGEVKSFTVVKSELFGKTDSPKEPGEHRTVINLSSQKSKDPKNQVPLTVHCTFVFATENEGRGFLRTLSMDMYVEELNAMYMEEPKGKADMKMPLVYPWKVKNVRYSNSVSP